MNTVELIQRYTPVGAGLEDFRLTLEPEAVDARANLANLADVDALFRQAMSGLSSRAYQQQRCPWARWLNDSTLACTLKIWVWPSKRDLKYTLTLPDGVSQSAPVLITEQKTMKLWFSGSNSGALPWLLEGANFSWPLGVFDRYGHTLPPPSVQLAGVDVRLTDGVYGVLQATGQAVGFRHDLTLHYQYVEGQVLRPENFTVTAGWRNRAGEDQKTSAEITIPECVGNLLDACSGGGSRSFKAGPHKSRVTVPVVYYSACTGRVLGYGTETAEDGTDENR